LSLVAFFKFVCIDLLVYKDNIEVKIMVNR